MVVITTKRAPAIKARAQIKHQSVARRRNRTYTSAEYDALVARIATLQSEKKKLTSMLTAHDEKLPEATDNEE